MKKLMIYPILALIFLVVVNIQGASAALFLSGDSNIIFEGITRDSGNQQFFLNILQGGKQVVVLDDVSWSYDDFGGTINTFYNTHGVSSTLIKTGTFTSADLQGANLFVAPLPDNPFTSDEISALKSLLARGGSVFFLGENQDPQYFSGYNSNINAALKDLGSGMSIVMKDPNSPGSFFDDAYTIDKIRYYPTATGLQIAHDPFTEGVTSFTYAAPSEVSGGKQIFFGSGGQPFVAYEVVPVPASAWLLGSGLLGLGVFRRRGRKYPAA